MERNEENSFREGERLHEEKKQSTLITVLVWICGIALADSYKDTLTFRIQ